MLFFHAVRMFLCKRIFVSVNKRKDQSVLFVWMVCSLFHIYGDGSNKRGRDWDRELSVVFLLYRAILFYFLLCVPFWCSGNLLKWNQLRDPNRKWRLFFSQSTKSTSSAILDKWIGPNIHFKDIFICSIKTIEKQTT